MKCKSYLLIYDLIINTDGRIIIYYYLKIFLQHFLNHKIQAHSQFTPPFSNFHRFIVYVGFLNWIYAVEGYTFLSFNTFSFCKFSMQRRYFIFAKRLREKLPVFHHIAPIASRVCVCVETGNIIYSRKIMKTVFNLVYTSWSPIFSTTKWSTCIHIRLAMLKESKWCTSSENEFILIQFSFHICDSFLLAFTQSWNILLIFFPFLPF